MGFVLAERGTAVTACILSGSAGARTNRPEIPQLRANTLAASGSLGFCEPILGDFPNLEFNGVAHRELVKFIEDTITATGATDILTHHPGDLNNDHLQTSRACSAAARLFQRRPGVPRLRSLRFMEVLSSTDWAFPGGGPAFSPDTFFEIEARGLVKKVAALRLYEGVMRDYPHPRSEEGIR
ncbi:MAG: PIG-L family deacetylase, partial [Gemmatimonadaceae bacterium]|nr:PIG-L family deacetylase [Gemmatimonadaceae bacterium]